MSLMYGNALKSIISDLKTWVPLILANLQTGILSKIFATIYTKISLHTISLDDEILFWWVYHTVKQLEI